MIALKLICDGKHKLFSIWILIGSPHYGFNAYMYTTIEQTNTRPIEDVQSEVLSRQLTVGLLRIQRVILY